MATLADKKKEIEEKFNKNKKEAVSIEEQMNVLKGKQQENINEMIRLQGAYSVLEELEKEEEKKVG